MDTFTFKNGITVTLSRVRAPALRHLLMGTGIKIATQAEAEKIAALPQEEQIKALGLSEADAWKSAEGTERLFSYLAGWGIKDDPPKVAREELVDMGFATTGKRAVRAAWVRYILIEDDQEAAALTQAIIAFTGQRAITDNG